MTSPTALADTSAPAPAHMPGALLADYLVAEGGVLGRRATGTLMGAHMIEQESCHFHTPPMDTFFLEMTIAGHGVGTAVVDDLITDCELRVEPGRVSFLPAERCGRFDVDVPSTFIQVTLAKSTIDAARRDLLRGDADRATLFAFNTLEHDRLKALMDRVGRLVRDPAADALAFDTLAHEIARALVADFTDRKLAPEGAAPRLNRAQALRSMDLLDACVAMPVGLDEIAAALEMEPHALALAFDARFGIDPARYLMERRVARACEWIAQHGEAVQRASARLPRGSNLDTLPPQAQRTLQGLARRNGMPDAAALDAAMRRCRGVGLVEWCRGVL